MNRSGCRPAAQHVAGAQRVVERGENQRGRRARVGGPADDAIGERVTHAGQPQHALTADQAREIGDPEPIRCGGPEVPVDQVRCGGVGRVLPGGAALPASPQVRALQPVGAHDPLDAFASDAHALAAQLRQTRGEP
jgi:hypothetical protein